MQFNKKQNLIIAVTVAIFIVGGGFKLVSDFLFSSGGGGLIDPLAGLVMPEVKAAPLEIEVENKKQIIPIEYTDDNSGEDFIIKTDKKEYNNFSSADVYFSIANNKLEGENTDIVFWFPEGGQKLDKLEKYVKDKKGNKWEEISLADKQIPDNKKKKPIGDNKPSKLGNARIGGRSAVYFKARISFKPMTKGEFFIEALGDKGGYGHLDPWYNSGWQYRMPVTLQGNKIATTGSFPVLATTTQNSLKTFANGGKVGKSDGTDIVWTDSDGTTLLNFQHESYNGSTGAIVDWVSVSLASSTDKTIYMYYGNIAAADLSTTTGVWDSNYIGVWHMNNDGSAATADSTKNGHNGATQGPSSVGGQIGNALSFVKTELDKVTIDSNLSSIASPVTVTGWVKMTDASAYYAVLWNKGNQAYNATNGFYVELANTASLTMRMTGSGGTILESSQVLTAEQWTHVAYVFNGTSGTQYKNGVSIKTGAVESPVANISNLSYFGFNGIAYNNYLNGALDEFRVSNVVRDQGWITTEYNNQSSVGGFMAFGNEEATTWYNSAWGYRKKITIQANKVIANQTNFPVLATTTDSGLAARARSDGYDILFTSADGVTKLNYERELYNNSTGQLVAWVNTNISSTTNTVLYMYYGNTGAADQSNASGVWNNNYVGVWHMGNAATASTTDSTSNANNGSTLGPSSNAGQIGNSFYFNASESDKVTIVTSSLLNTSNPVTFSAWVKMSDLTSYHSVLWNKGDTTFDQPGWFTEIGPTEDVKPAGHLRMVGNGPLIVRSGASVSQGVWEYVTWVFSGSTGIIYRSGLQVYTDTVNPASANGLTKAYFGYNGTSYNGYLNGYLDEIRVSNSIRDANWILTEYRNQSDVGTFMTFESEEAFLSAVSGAGSSQGVKVKGGTRYKGGMRFR